MALRSTALIISKTTTYSKETSMLFPISGVFSPTSGVVFAGVSKVKRFEQLHRDQRKKDEHNFVTSENSPFVKELYSCQKQQKRCEKKSCLHIRKKFKKILSSCFWSKWHECCVQEVLLCSLSTKKTN